MTGVGRKADPRELRYVTFVSCRVHGWNDEDIAAKCECGSAAHLYRRLRADGYPVCPTCGASPISEGHACKPKRQPGPGTGEGRELPAVFRASDLFTDALRDLLASVADLEHRHESSQDGRILGMDVIGGSSLYLSRRGEIRGKVVENYPENQWNELCARHGEDPEVEGFWVDSQGLNRAAGAARHPAEPLTTLIAVYALAGGDMEQLLERLYPGAPTQGTREAIRKRVEGKKKRDKIDGLKAIAGQLAALVRGQALVGAPPPGLTPTEHDAACYITLLRDEKRPYEDILAKLSKHRMADGSTPSMADVHRLAALKLRYAEN
jgi:hypothetical protein